MLMRHLEPISKFHHRGTEGTEEAFKFSLRDLPILVVKGFWDRLLVKKPAINGPGGQAGVTLVETLIAMFILMFGLLAVAQLFAVAVLNNTLARSKTFATQAAQQKLEDLQSQYDLWLKLRAERKTTASDPFPLTGSQDVEVRDSNQGTSVGGTDQPIITQDGKQIDKITDEPFNRFKVEWKAEKEPQTQNVYRVEVTVTPENQSKFNQTIRFTTYFAP